MKIEKIVDLHPESFSRYASLAEQNDFASTQRQVSQQDQTFSGEATAFLPFGGIHFSICGPMRVGSTQRFPADLDVPMTVFMLTLSGTARYEVSEGGRVAAVYECGRNNYFAARFPRVRCASVLEPGPSHCHLEFFLEDGAVGRNFGPEASRNIASALAPPDGGDGPEGSLSVASGAAGAGCLALAKKIVALRGDKDVGSLGLRGACLELLSMLAKNIGAAKRREMAPLSRRETEALRRLKEDLEERFLEEVSLKEFCARTGLGLQRANRGFVHLYRSTIGQYRLNCRLDRAHDLLLSGDVNVSQCAWDVGYSNISHFVAVFKNRFGVTPGSLLSASKVPLKKN
ncbi:MAG: AraC family transcriptional regulator [Deltaproteobacteria bacterium]|jgi:AraC-like DNA-binding protein|nr:AraC family transcriptional regulator [Deltaproteobacteria bacterium]